MAVIFGAISALAFGFESHITRRDLIVKEISKTVRHIDGDVFQSNHSGLVYYRTYFTSFNLVRDDEFNIAEYCGALERNVQYCQWQEMQHRHTQRRGNETYTYYTYSYYKGWVRSPINSLFFHNKIYVNPHIEQIPEIVNRRPIRAGKYMLDNTIGLHGPRERLSPHSQQILQFEQSQLSSAFKYAGRGIFYREYESGILGKLLKIATFFDTENADRFDWCTPGDTRVWFEYWAPKAVTVVGDINGNTITSKEIKGYKIGAASAKHMRIEEIVKANASWFPVIMMWVTRVALVVILYFEIKMKNGMAGFTLAAGVLIICTAHIKDICNKIENWQIVLSYSALAGISCGLLHYLFQKNVKI